MFELQYMVVYTGAEVSNALRYGSNTNEIVRSLANRFEFMQRVPKPVKPSKMANRRAWDEYRFQEEKYRRYRQSVDGSDKFVVDLGAKYVITHHKGVVWLNYRTNKEVSLYDSDLRRNPFQYVGHYIKETKKLIVLQCGRLYVVDFETDEIEPWRIDNG